METDLNVFDEIYDFIVEKVNQNDFKAIRILISEHIFPDSNRGIQRTILVTLKPIRHLDEICVEFIKLADCLRSTSTHGII